MIICLYVTSVNYVIGVTKLIVNDETTIYVLIHCFPERWGNCFEIFPSFVPRRISKRFSVKPVWVKFIMVKQDVDSVAGLVTI